MSNSFALFLISRLFIFISYSFLQFEGRGTSNKSPPKQEETQVSFTTILVFIKSCNAFFHKYIFQTQKSKDWIGYLYKNHFMINWSKTLIEEFQKNNLK